MSCRSCGSAISEDESVCTSCGANLGASASSAGAIRDKVWTKFNTPLRRFAIPSIIFVLVLPAIAAHHAIQPANRDAAASANLGHGLAQSMAVTSLAPPENAPQTVQAKATKLTPEILIGLPAGSGIYSYRGIELGESQTQVMARLKEFGYLTWKNNGLDRYDAQEDPESGISGMNVWFKHGRLEELVVQFDSSYVEDYLNAVTSTYGPLTYRPKNTLAEAPSTETAWLSRLAEPCERIAVADYFSSYTTVDPGTHAPRTHVDHVGFFFLTNLDSSDMGVTMNLCSPS